MGAAAYGQLARTLWRRARWDRVMLVLALVDLAFIGFDLSYLTLRDSYRAITPWVADLYDPVKGIRPHPTSARLLSEIEAARGRVDAARQEGAEATLDLTVERLRHATQRLLREGTLSRGDGGEDLDGAFRSALAHATGVDPADLDYPELQHSVVRVMWPAERDALAAQLEAHGQDVSRPLRASFYRDRSRTGAPVDRFVWLELPLLALFWIDFWRGYLRARRREPGRSFVRHMRRHWYDVLGLLPGSLRLFRLLRVLSIYARIHRGELRELRDNVVLRLSAKLNEALLEELTNRVQIRVVERLELELTEQTIQRSLAEGVRDQQEAIVEHVVDQVHHVVSDPDAQKLVRKLASLTADEVLSSRRRRAWPFARDLTRTFADRALVSALEGLGQALETERGRDTLRRLLLNVSTRAQHQESFQRLQRIASDISLEVVRAVGASAHKRKQSGPRLMPGLSDELGEASESRPPMRIEGVNRRRRAMAADASVQVQDLTRLPDASSPDPARNGDEASETFDATA